MPKIIPIYTTVPGQGFTVLDLDLGEIALNVNDGTLYLKKETGGASSVVILAGSGSSVVTASYSLTSSYASYANIALNATNSLNTLFGVYSLHSYYSHIARTASLAYKADYSEFALKALTATNASTASLPIRGIITASAAGSTITFTKGDNSTFNVSVTTATAETASYVTSSNVDGPFGKNSILSASYALTSSLPLRGLITASAVGSTITFTKGDSSTFNVTVTTATAETASYVSSSNVDGPFGKNSILSASFAVTASYVLNAVSASYALSASQAVSASYALSSSQAISSSFALSASFAQTASYAPSSLSASYASTSSNIEGGTTNYITLWRTNTALTSSVIYQSGSNITIGGGAVLPSAKLEVKGAGSTSATAALNVINVSSTDLLYLRNDGFVGIGTASAASTENMYVKKQRSVFNQGTDLTNYTIVDVSNTTSTLRLGVETNSGGSILTGTTAYAGIVGTINNFPLQFVTNNTVKATLLNTGNFGIGITSPLYTLDVSGSARITSSVFLPGLTNNSQPNFVSYNSSTGQLYYLSTSSFTAATASNVLGGTQNYIPIWSTNTTLGNSIIYQSGNSIGVGTTTPTFVVGTGVHIKGNNDTNLRIAAASNTGLDFTQAADATVYIYNRDNAPMIFGTNDGEDVRITAEGRVIVNNSAGFGAYQFQVNGNIYNTTDATFAVNSGNVGIGTTSANYKLDVSGSGNFTNNLTATGSIRFPSLTNINQANIISYNATTGQLYYQTTSSFTAATASYVTSSNVFGPFGSNSILSASYSISSSQAQNAVTASYVLNAISASYAATASFVQNAISASFASTASYVLNAISASYAATASSADNFTVRGTLTAQTIVAQVITSSTDFVTGSTRFGTLLSNTHQFTGSVSITGSLNVVGAGITGSLFGTASLANNAITASNALTASYVLNAVSASFASTASFVQNAISASFASTASYVLNAVSASFATSASQAVTASYILNAISASFALTSSLPLRGLITASAAGSTITFTKGDSSTFNITLTTALADTASYVTSSNVDGPYGKNSILSASFAISSSQAQNATTASYITSSKVFGPFGSNSILSASYAVSASQAQNTVSASYALSASNAQTASYVLNAVSSSFASTASYVLNAVSASFASTASFVQNAVSASFAATASSANNFTVRGTLTAQTIVVQTITSSTDFVTGSSRFGTLLSNTHQFTGSVSMTGSLTVVGAGITGSLFGTSSWAVSASQAVTASYILNAVSASFTSTASYVLNAVSASFASTASFVQNAISASFASTASFVLNAVSASFASTASFITSSRVFGPHGANSVLSASYAVSASQAFSSSYALTASFIQNAVSASFASTASFVTASGVFGPFGSNSVISASFAVSASRAVSASFALTASRALTASVIIGGSPLYIPIWEVDGTLGISQIYQTASIYPGGTNISFNIATAADGSADVIFDGISIGSNPYTQINHTYNGLSSFVNYGFNSETGSGFYGSGSGTLDSVKLSFRNTDKFEFSSSGMFRAADDIVAFYSFSDRNLKYDIRQICGSVALDQVQQLQGVYYKWIGDQGSRANREEVGLIAQDVEKVVPQLVREQERLGQGKFKMVDYEHLTALLIEAVKEQQKQIDELKAKIDALTK